MDDLTQELLELLATLRRHGPHESVMRLRALVAVSQRMDTPSLLRLGEQAELGESVAPRRADPAPRRRVAPETRAVTPRASRM